MAITSPHPKELILVRDVENEDRELLGNYEWAVEEGLGYTDLEDNLKFATADCVDCLSDVDRLDTVDCTVFEADLEIIASDTICREVEVQSITIVAPGLIDKGDGVAAIDDSYLRRQRVYEILNSPSCLTVPHEGPPPLFTPKAFGAWHQLFRPF